MTMTKHQLLAAKLSLAFLWIFTGLTSLFFASEVGYEILESGGVTGPLAEFCVITGALADILIGLWVLLNKYQRLCFCVQVGIILIFTLLLTIIAPSFWLHPFGPVTKNIPIIVLIWATYSNND
jgi:DoxX-like family